MKLTLKPHNRNQYPIGGVLIKSASPKVWLHEMQAMNLSLHSVNAFAIPSSTANELYGCLVITHIKPEFIGKNSYVQVIDEVLFIPEYATITPSVAPEEWESIFKGHSFIMLPEIGLFEMEEPINWSDLLNSNSKVNVKITTPVNSVFIPSRIQSVRYELSVEDLLKELENPLSEEEIFEQLPFNIKKLLNGNQREMEKYLAYIDKNPEMALKLGIPLDTLGTSRGNNWGQFSFGSGFFDNFFGGLNSNGSSKIRSIITSKAAVILMVVVFLSVFMFNVFSTSSVPTTTQKSDIQSKAVLATFVVVMTLLIVKLIFTSSFSISRQFNYRSTVILLILLVIALLILLYPIYEKDGFDSKFSILILILVGILLYRVFNANATILNNDEK